MVYGILEQPFPSLEAINTSGLQTGLQRVQLLKPEIPVPKVPADTRTMEIRAPDVLIPGQETTYWCYISELPQGFARHHIVMVCGVGVALLFPRVPVSLTLDSSHGPVETGARLLPETLAPCSHPLQGL